MVLAGPEHFFKHGKCIMPWHDEPDSEPESSPVSSKRTIASGCTFQPDHPALYEQSPHSPMPADWQVEPTKAGVTIRVQQPTITVGHILRHCKDRGFPKRMAFLFCWNDLFKFSRSTLPVGTNHGPYGDYLLNCWDPQRIDKQDQIHLARQRHGGDQLAVFKIGITSCLEVRVQYYYEANFNEMCCIHATNSLAQIETLEACLIDFYLESSHSGPCRNIAKGGEGMRTKKGFPRNPPPYFLYVVAANAAQIKRIGG